MGCAISSAPQLTTEFYNSDNVKKINKNLIASVHHFWQGDHGHLGLTILGLTGATDGFMSFIVHRPSCSALTDTAPTDRKGLQNVLFVE